MNYKEMKELLLTTLDTMDRYNRIIRQLLEEDGIDTDPTPEDTEEVDEPIIEDSDVDLNIIEEVNNIVEEVISDTIKEDPLVEIVPTMEQKEKEPKQLKIPDINTDNIRIIGPDKTTQRLNYAQEKIYANKFLCQYIRDNDPELKNKPELNMIYEVFKVWCEEVNINPTGKIGFGKILDGVYINKKNANEKIKKHSDIIPKGDANSGIHDYMITPDNLESIKPLLRVGDVVGLNHAKFDDIAFQVVGINIDGPNTVTLITRDCLLKRNFDRKTTSYEKSNIRRWLHDNFLLGLEIMDSVVAVEKKTLSDYEHSKLVKTTDYCWIPSRDELLLEDITKAEIYENTKYPFFKEAADRIKKFKNEPCNYLTRTSYRCDKDTAAYRMTYRKSNYMYKVDRDGQIRNCSGSRDQGIVIGLCI